MSVWSIVVCIYDDHKHRWPKMMAKDGHIQCGQSRLRTYSAWWKIDGCVIWQNCVWSCTGQFVKSLRDFRPLWYRTRDGHAEGEHDNRGWATPSFYPASAFLACTMYLILRAPDKHFLHMLESLGRWPRSARSFHSAEAATLLEFHAPLTNCCVCRWFCLVHGRNFHCTVTLTQFW
jgi:hypothetical protein